MDRRAKWFTTILLAIILGLAAVFYFTSSGSYLPGWFLILILAVSLLAALSIPRFTSVTKTSIEIHCLMDLTVIPIGNIKRIETVSKKDLKWCLAIPLFGIYGMFGYFGYYFDFKNLKIFKLYASRWNDFILIENIYEEIVILSCQNSEELIDQVKRNIHICK